MCNGYVVDLIVVELRIAMSENVAEPCDISGVRNRFRNGGRHLVEIARRSSEMILESSNYPVTGRRRARVESWAETQSRPPGTATHELHRSMSARHSFP